MADSFFGLDLNVRLEDDDDGNLSLDLNEHENDDGNTSFDLNEPVHDENGNGTTSSSLVHVKHYFFSSAACTTACSSFFIGFDLNLPLDEFRAVDFHYVQNLAGKHGYYFDYVLLKCLFYSYI
jgi:hypothetical protein